MMFSFPALFMLAAASVGSNQEWEDTFIEEQMASHRIPGVAIAIVTPDHIEHLKGFGFADIDNEIPVDPDTVFRVGSNSKPITASTVMALVSNYDVALDTDLRPYLTDLPIRPSLDQPLTFHQLLSHTAGFNEALFGQHSTVDDWVALKPYLEQHLPPRFIEPGEIIAYVDFHTALAGYVAEAITGQSFQRYTEDAIFNPLGMTSSTFQQTDLPGDIAQKRARSYRDLGTHFVPYEFDAIATTPAAGLYTSATDMTKYLQWLLQGWRGGQQTLVPDQAIRDQLSIQARHHAALEGRAYGFAERHFNGWRVLYKDGQATGFNARIVIVPDAEIAFFIVHNVNILEPGGKFSGARNFVRDFTDAFLENRLTERGPLENLEHTPTAPALPLTAYTGHFRTAIAARHSWEKLTSAFDTVDVTVENDQLLVFGRPAHAVGDHLFADAEHGRLRAFRIENGKASHIFFGPSAYERTPWFEHPQITGIIAIGFFTSFLVIAASMLVPAGRRAFGISAGLGSMTCIVFFAGFSVILLTTDPQIFFHGMSPFLQFTLALPVVALAATGFGFFRSLTGNGGKFSAVPLAIMFAFAAWLWQWNLLGWQLN